MVELGRLHGRSLARSSAIKRLFEAHKRSSSPDSRSRRLLHDWLSPAQRIELAEKGYFDVVGGTTGKRYRIFPAASMNVVELDDLGRELRGLCFLPLGQLPIGDTILAQKIALEAAEPTVQATAGQFAPLHFRFGRRKFRW